MIRTRSVQFVILVAVFVVFTVVVASGATLVADDAAARYFKSAQGNSAIDAAMIIVTSTGDVTTLFVFGIIITIIRRTRKIGMVFLIALVLLVVLVTYMKPVVGRHVPPYGFEPSAGFLRDFMLENDSFSPIAAEFSYPSGHASRAAALAFIVGFALYNKSKVAGYAIWSFPVIIGVTRLYVMQHYPTDIAAGIVFGAIVSIVLSNAMKLDQPFYMSRFKGKEGDKAPGGRVQGEHAP